MLLLPLNLEFTLIPIFTVRTNQIYISKPKGKRK